MAPQPNTTSAAGPADTITGSAAAARTPPTACSCTREWFSSPEGHVLVLRVGGELDLATLPALDRALDTSLAEAPAHLVVDLARVTFCSARGMALLVDTAATAVTRGVGYTVAGAPAQLDRAWTKLWREHELPTRCPSTAAAVTRLRAGPEPSR